MGQFTVRNIEDDVKARLKRRATSHGLSMEAEVRQILRNAVKDDEAQVGGGAGQPDRCPLRGAGPDRSLARTEGAGAAGRRV